MRSDDIDDGLDRQPIESVTTMTPAERDELAAIERAFEYHEKDHETLARQSVALLQPIRDKRLYRGAHRSFDGYLRARWNFSRQRAHQLIRMMQVNGTLSSTMVDGTCLNERAARVLAPLSADDARAVYQAVRAEAPDGRITASALQIKKAALLRSRLPPPTLPHHPATYYHDDFVTLIHADARDVVPTIPGDALIVTDVPYNVDYNYDAEYRDALPADEYAALLRDTLRPPCVVIHYPEPMFQVARILGLDPSEIVTWVYNSNTPRQSRTIAWFGCRPDFSLDSQPYKNPKDPRIRRRIEQGLEARGYDWMYEDLVKNVSAEKTDHPCQIPTAVMLRILRMTLANVIIDPFCGSGSTLVAAKRLGIRCIGIEQSAKFCEIAAQRVRAVSAPVAANLNAADVPGADDVPRADLEKAVRRIREEMDSFPFIARTWNYLDGERGLRGNAAGGHADVVAGAAGAPVFHDIVAAGGRGTRREVLNSIDRWLTGGTPTVTTRAIESVARGRLEGDRSLSPPWLPPEAGDLGARTE